MSAPVDAYYDAREAAERAPEKVPPQN
jgi:hypothetical protein